jgi:type I restriction enzyme, R subunit
MMDSLVHTSEADVQQEMISVAKGQGWRFIPRKEMSSLRGSARMNEAIVEPLLIEAIQDLNPWLEEDGVREVAARVRRISSDREMLDVLRDGVPYKPTPKQPTKDVTIVATADPAENSYIVTEEFPIRTGGQREPRLDVVFLVNGLPLGAFENKDTSELLASAADDWRGYWADAPQLVAQTSVIGCCNGIHAVVGPSGMASIDTYMEWTDAWPHRAEDADDPMLVALTGAFHPHTLVDLAANFVLFETREGETEKKLARSHQYRAANKIVQRVAIGELDRGIVWHATGSGKSLTMVFAARKLLRVGLGSPTVLIVIDRNELDEQISETLTACEFDGVERAKTRRHLEELLQERTGGVVVTTVHKFDEEMAGLLTRRPVVGFVDEAHRTQFGKFAIWMRKALPRAFLFGFTGTPIEKDARSTRVAFSPVLKDGSYESYLDRYGFDEAVADGATVPLIYEPRLVDWQLASPGVDQQLAELTPNLSEGERDSLREEAATQKVVAKAGARVAAVAEDVVRQMQDRISPLGLVGQVVLVDREACALFAEALSEHLGSEEFAVIMSRSKKDSSPRLGEVDLRRWYPAAQWERVHGSVPVTDGSEHDQETEEGYVLAGDRAAIKDFIARFKREDDPLALLVVNNMLITGFDAPNEGALFLDRGLTGHTLIQAINRPNRRYPGKDRGIVFDYWGLFSNLSAALAEFAAADLQGLVEDSQALVARFPLVLNETAELIGTPPEVSPRRRMLWLVRQLSDDPKRAEQFEELVREAQSIFEVLSPDPRLATYLDRYTGLLELWTAWVRGSRRDRRGRDELRNKTRNLVQEAIGFKRIREDLPAAAIDSHFLSALKEGAEDLSPEERRTEIEAAVQHEVEARGEDDPLARTLAERLAYLREKQEREVQMTVETLAEWEDLVRQHVDEQERVEQLGLAPAGGIALAVFRRTSLQVDDAILVESAKEIAAAYGATAGFEGWSERTDVVQGLRKAVIQKLVTRPETRQITLEPQVIEELLAGLATLDKGRGTL